MDYYDEVSNDALSIRGFQEYRCNDYHLGKFDNMYFVAALSFTWSKCRETRNSLQHPNEQLHVTLLLYNNCRKCGWRTDLLYCEP